MPLRCVLREPLPLSVTVPPLVRLSSLVHRIAIRQVVSVVVLSSCCFSSANEGPDGGKGSTGTAASTGSTSGSSTAGTTSSAASSSGSAGTSSGMGSSTSTSTSSSGSPSSGGALTGACRYDIDCPACGWVCSKAQGNVCIPTLLGDPGWCAANADCACPLQTCSGNHCSPPSQTLVGCRCNSDCPNGSICDQLFFSCTNQPQPGQQCLGHPGECGCGFVCGGGTLNPSCWAWSDPLECGTDADCNTCQTGNICVHPDSGMPPGCASAGNSWCL